MQHMQQLQQMPQMMQPFQHGRPAQKQQQQQQQQACGKQFQRGAGLGGNMQAMAPTGPTFQGNAGGDFGGCQDRHVNMQGVRHFGVPLPPGARDITDEALMNQQRECVQSGGKCSNPSMQVQSLMAARQQPLPETMKSQLQSLSLEDPARVFIVRRINKLGFASSGQLRLHFSRYAEVKGVHVSHSRVKSLRPTGERRSPNVQWRLRAAALGFVVMSSREAVQCILEDGPEHEVNGVMVRVHPFHRRSVNQLSEQEAEYHLSAVQGAAGSDHMLDDLALEEQHQSQALWSPLGMPYACPEAPIEGYGICEGVPLNTSLMYVSEQDLQDAMPPQYED